MTKTTSKGLALVTGSAKRIGRAIALELADAGWDIGLHFHTSEKEALATAREIEKLGRRVLFLQADLADPEQIKTMLAKISAETPAPFLTLVNNASLFVKDDDPQAEKLDAVNVEAPRLLIEALAAQISASAQACVINLLEGTEIPASFSRYMGGKITLRDMTLGYAKTLAPRLRVNGILVGPALINPRQSQKHFENMLKGTKLGCGTSPTEIAKTVRFLVETPSITGALIPLDGNHALA